MAASRKETGWWTENIVSSAHHVSLAGYGIKYFKELGEVRSAHPFYQLLEWGAFFLVATMRFFVVVSARHKPIPNVFETVQLFGSVSANSCDAKADPGEWEEGSEVKMSRKQLINIEREKEKHKKLGLFGRRRLSSQGGGEETYHSATFPAMHEPRRGRPLLENGVVDEGGSKHHPSCGLITGEATPSMLYWKHKGLTLLPRWMACVHPQVRLIVTLRDPVQRTYSDFNFFGRLQVRFGNLELLIMVKQGFHIMNLCVGTRVYQGVQRPDWPPFQGPRAQGR